MIELSKAANEMLATIRESSEEFKATIRTLDARREPGDLRDQALALLAARAIRLTDAFCMVADAGYGESAAASARAVYETQLFMRWVIKEQANAQRFFGTAKAQGAKITRSMVKHEGVKHAIPSSLLETVEKILASDVGKLEPPKFGGPDGVATAVNCTPLHEIVYPTLSAMAHPNFLGLGEALIRRTITFLPNADNIELLLNLLPIVLHDCHTVYGVWMGQRRLAPPPRISLLGMK